MVLQKHWKYPHFNLVLCPNFYTIHGVLKARILKWFAIPSPVDHILSDLSTMTRPTWVAPQAWLSFIELDKAVVLVWLDWLVFCDYGFSVSALWCPLATPTFLLGFLLAWTWGFSSGHVWMGELDYEESWAPKNWCLWTVVWRRLLRVP